MSFLSGSVGVWGTDGLKNALFPDFISFACSLQVVSPNAFWLQWKVCLTKIQKKYSLNIGTVPQCIGNQEV